MFRIGRRWVVLLGDGATLDRLVERYQFIRNLYRNSDLDMNLFLVFTIVTSPELSEFNQLV